MARHMTREQKQMACRLDAKGLSHKEIARDLNYSLHSIEVALLGDYRRNAPADEWTPAPGRLSADEREEILVGLSRGNRCPPSLEDLVEPLRRSPERWRPMAVLGTTEHGRDAVGPRCRRCARRPPNWIILPSSSR